MKYVRVILKLFTVDIFVFCEIFRANQLWKKCYCHCVEHCKFHTKDQRQDLKLS